MGTARMNHALLPQVRLPAVSFVSQAEYDAWCDHAAPLIAAQARTDHAALAAADPQASRLDHAATCAPCLRPTNLAIEVGDKAAGRRGRQVCDCEDALTMPARALLHAAGVEGGLQPWSRLLLFGPAAAEHPRLAALSADATHLAGFGSDGRLDAPDGRFHLALASASLPLVAEPLAGMAELRRVLAPGGTLLAQFAFRPRARRSVAQPIRRESVRDGMAPHDAHDFGWDILATLRELGFAQATMLRLWSHELGYWGGSNFILKAVA